eukprot:scaffold22302_cov95-Skeletonema_marinoi.AAC.1
MANYYGSLEAVDCHIHSCEIRYERQKRTCSVSDGLIRSRRYGQLILEQRQRCFYTIITDYNGSLEAVDCHIHSVRYDMVLESCWRPSRIGPHQVTYDVVATPIRGTND